MAWHRYRITLDAEISHNPKWEWASVKELPMIRKRLTRALPRIKTAVRTKGLRLDDLKLWKVEPRSRSRSRTKRTAKRS